MVFVEMVVSKVNVEKTALVNNCQNSIELPRLVHDLVSHSELYTLKHNLDEKVADYSEDLSARGLKLLDLE